MSTWTAPSWVAERTAWTSQVLSEEPAAAAASSALVLSDSGSRRVIRATLASSSTSSGRGGAGGAGGVGGAGGAASTTKSRSRPSRRTSTPPAGIEAVISAAAWESASIRASRVAGSRA